MKMLSAGVVVVRRQPDEFRYLLLRVYRNWDFPKGQVEAGEDPLQAALREVKEETSLCDLQFTWGHDYRETPPYARGKVARLYLAETQTATVVLGLNPQGIREHHEARWLTYAEARPLLMERLQKIIDWADAQIRFRH